MLLQAMRATLTQDPQFHMIRALDGIEHPGSVVKMRLDTGFSGNEGPGEFILTAKDDQAHALISGAMSWNSSEIFVFAPAKPA